MFTPQAVTAIYKSNRAMLDRVLELEKALIGRFYGMEDAVRCMMLSAMTGEAMVMIGPPGTAKSRLIRAFCSLIGVLDHDPREQDKGTDGATAKKDERYFEYLLTQFTEPSELFGYFDLSKLMDQKDPRLERNVLGQMQRAEVVFLDEVFNASSAILNALLTFMNERKFHDRVVYPTPLKMLFGATNHPPREEGLGAVYDRFLLRCRMENAPAGHDAISRLLSAAWTETHSHADAGQGHFKDLPDVLEIYRDAIETMTTEGKLVVDPLGKALPHLAAMVAMVRTKELSEMSNRRLVKFSAIVLAEALLRSAQADAAEAEILPRDLGVILTYGLDQDDPGTVAKMRQDLLLG